MAEKTYTFTQLNGGVLVLWENVTGSDTGQALEPGKAAGAIASVQFVGTFGDTILLQGSNDGTNWATLKDVGGNDISTTGAAIFDLSTAVRYVRPSPGASISDVDVYMTLRTG